MFSVEGTYSLRDGRDPREEFGTVPALEDCEKWGGVSMNARTGHEPFGILPWVARLLSLGGMQVVLYADYFIVQGRWLP